MKNDKKCSLFPLRWSSFIQKIIATVKYWIINWFLSGNKKIIWNDKGQVVRLSTAGDWIEGCNCILEKKSWPIDVKITWKRGLFQRHVCTKQNIGSYPPPPAYEHGFQNVWYSDIFGISTARMFSCWLCTYSLGWLFTCNFQYSQCDVIMMFCFFEL